MEALASPRPADHDSTYSLHGGFRWQTDYGLIVNDNYFNRSFDTLLFGPLDGGNSPLTTDLAVSKLEDQFKIGADNTFRVGVEYRNKTFSANGSPEAEVLPERTALEENNYAASAAWLWQVNDKLSWTNAGRFDHLDMTETGTLPAGSYFNYADYGHVINTFSGNSGFNYKATDNDTFRLSYGRGVQEPSMIESGVGQFSNIGVLFEFLGNPELKPTIVQNYELDYDRKISGIYSTAKFAVFYQENRDIKAFTSAGFVNFNGVPALLYTPENVGNSQGWGGEIELKGDHDGFRWDASYSFARVDDDPQAGSFWTMTDPLPNTISAWWAAIAGSSGNSMPTASTLLPPIC